MDPLELARGFEAEFWEDMTALNVAPPVVQTRVTEHIPAIVSYVKQLEKNGYAYAAPDGVYFDTTAFGARGHTYGKMANVTTADPEAEDDATPAGMKRNPKDFALWKLSKGSGGMVWPSPWGSGRPGWHIECSAMTHAIFGSKLDVHGGGVDLK
jgi:cysteinyl-tRNA synthetase